MPSDAEPRWLRPDHAIEINKWAVEETGENFLIRSEALLESACARPLNLWHYANERDITRLAVSLLAGIVRNHPFEQGNKRTGVGAALMFMDANGHDWTQPDDGTLAAWVVALINNEIDEDELADRMRPHVAARE